VEGNGRWKLCCGDACGGNYRVDLLGGLRYLNLLESLDMTEQIQYAPTVAVPALRNATQHVEDHFNTLDQFFGAQLGLDARWNFGPWSIDVRPKVALGVTGQKLLIQGSNVVNEVSGVQLSAPGGLLAEPTNSGRHLHDAFSVVPELTLNAGYQFTPWCRGFIGYNFLYWTNVIRPGEQIDTVVNSNQVLLFGTPSAVPVTRPAVTTFHQTDVWVQGLTLGLEFCY
jgi:hypothetical protein